MSQQNLTSQIGQAWNYHRQGNNREAIAEFEKVVKTAPDSVDALYGLGLSQRSAGDKTSAIETFRKAYILAKTTLADLRANNVGNNLQSIEDDRFMMLVRMTGQRLAELGVHDEQS
ncbi:MAG: tetratricopeptide repeat protein [Chitinophagaceae bacterium]|nr:tetratricopeptide repeat protein [Anaerolineae bacterium]